MARAKKLLYEAFNDGGKIDVHAENERLAFNRLPAELLTAQ